MSLPPSPPLPPASYSLVNTSLPALPLPPNSSRPPILTPRLLLRPLLPTDLPALFTLRSQPSVMANNPQGRPDASASESLPHLNRFLPPNDVSTYNFAICLRDRPDEMIGLGGCHRLDVTSLFGWPVVGYQLREEYWGRGLATEFLKAWLEAWGKLPRENVERRVHPATVVPVSASGGEGDCAEVGAVTVAEEVLSSWVLSDNVASQRVLEKGGMELCLVQREKDLRDQGKEVELRVYRYSAGRKREGERRV
ncbi:GNAT domain-containing protein [Immersiella caudata]|uniref:GNAT domain-containing protein n=1 Tax=Immersiella caudata TaxID=314043 RepID=A0AA40BXQ6_9PEZI|nr:GNAT domain-containing protein [Immersiella caudata]